MIKKGSIVRFNPKWCREEERGYLFGVREYREDTGICTIMCLNKKSTFGYRIEDVTLEMIVDTGLTVKEGCTTVC